MDRLQKWLNQIWGTLLNAQKTGIYITPEFIRVHIYVKRQNRQRKNGTNLINNPLSRHCAGIVCTERRRKHARKNAKFENLCDRGKSGEAGADMRILKQSKRRQKRRRRPMEKIGRLRTIIQRCN